MASITIRNLDDSLKSRLRIQATVHGRATASLLGPQEARQQ